MTEREALKHLKATIEAFGPDEGIELDQKAWSKLHSAIKEALAQPEPCDMGELCIGCSPRNADGSCPDAQPEQEPLFWFDTTQNHAVIRADVFATVPQSQRKGWEPLYTPPIQRKPWVSLSWSTQISKEAEKEEQAYGFVKGAQWAEAKLRELNEAPQRKRVQFPTMLRKMWSGGEVQAWLDENVNKGDA